MPKMYDEVTAKFICAVIDNMPTNISAVVMKSWIDDRLKLNLTLNNALVRSMKYLDTLDTEISDAI